MIKEVYSVDFVNLIRGRLGLRPLDKGGVSTPYEMRRAAWHVGGCDL